ncbi:MAG TPA: AEC family transporter [Spirochaetales bacterium]|nr:AEC family transporter [Spirochaetales bacterium]
MLNALGSVFSVLLMIALGFVLARRSWFSASGYAGGGANGQAVRERASKDSDGYAGGGANGQAEDFGGKLISRLVVNVSLPAYMIANLMGGYDRARLLSMLPGLPIPFLSMAAAFASSAAVAALFKIRPERRGTFSSMASLSNTIFIGLPVNMMIFGEESLPYVLIYYIANTVMFWTLGVYGISGDGARLAGNPAPRFLSPTGLRRLLSPPLLGLMVAIVLIMLGVDLPKPLLDTARTIGSMTTPLSMLFIGIVIAKVDWRSIRLERDLVLVALCRFVVSPAIVILLLRLTDLPMLMKQVFFVQSMMPAMTQTPILVATYGADIEFAGLGTSMTTMLSLLVIPACLALSPLVL